MEVILSFLVVLTGVLLYDYFTARKWQQVTSGTRNDIVFENRNKEYGAYALRRNYDKNMVLIMASVILGIGLTYGLYYFISNIEEPVVDPPKIDTSQFTIQAPPLEETPPPPEEIPPPPTETTVAFMPPVVVDIPVEDVIPPQDKLEDTKASDKDQKGDDTNFDVVQDVVVDKKEEVVQKEEEILTFVDEEAQYVGGVPAMNEFIQKKINYPETAIELGIQGKCYVKFVVNSNGDISNVHIARGVPDCPECDKEAIRVVQAMPNWKPGKMNGKPVRTWCQLPINFTLQ